MNTTEKFELATAAPNLAATMKFITAVNMLAESLQSEFVQSELAPACTEDFLLYSIHKIQTLESDFGYAPGSENGS